MSFLYTIPADNNQRPPTFQKTMYCPTPSTCWIGAHRLDPILSRNTVLDSRCDTSGGFQNLLKVHKVNDVGMSRIPFNEYIATTYKHNASSLEFDWSREWWWPVRKKRISILFGRFAPSALASILPHRGEQNYEE